VLDRRTLAVLQAVANALWLVVLSEVASRWTDVDPRRPPPLAVAAGLAYAVAFHGAYDRDVGGARRRRSRRLGLVVLFNLLRLPARRASPADRYGFAVGSCLGTTTYRLQYGVLGPFPDAGSG
jgi:hypothetical protein